VHVAVRLAAEAIDARVLHECGREIARVGEQRVLAVSGAFPCLFAGNLFWQSAEYSFCCGSAVKAVWHMEGTATWKQQLCIRQR
jgi:hypothetical protein